MAHWGEESDGVLVYETESGSLSLQLTHEQPLNGIEFSPDGKRIFAGGTSTSEGETARMWDAESGLVLYEVTGHEREVNDIAYASNGRWVATASEDGSARIWDVRNIEGESPLVQLDADPADVWHRVQMMLRYTISDEDEVIELWPTGPRQIAGWDPELENALAQ
ncbi:MAG: WD40 repeat domain-containing protein [Acidobacteriota bacterium]